MCIFEPSFHTWQAGEAARGAAVAPGKALALELVPAAAQVGPGKALAWGLERAAARAAQALASGPVTEVWTVWIPRGAAWVVSAPAALRGEGSEVGLVGRVRVRRPAGRGGGELAAAARGGATAWTGSAWRTTLHTSGESKIGD